MQRKKKKKRKRRREKSWNDYTRLSAECTQTMPTNIALQEALGVSSTPPIQDQVISLNCHQSS